MHTASTMSIIFDITRRVFGPTEQPKSATFMQFGEESQYNLVIVSSSITLALSTIFLCSEMKGRSIYTRKENYDIVKTIIFIL